MKQNRPAGPQAPPDGSKVFPTFMFDEGICSCDLCLASWGLQQCLEAFGSSHGAKVRSQKAPPRQATSVGLGFPLPCIIALRGDNRHAPAYILSFAMISRRGNITASPSKGQ